MPDFNGDRAALSNFVTAALKNRDKKLDNKNRDAKSLEIFTNGFYGKPLNSTLYKKQILGTRFKGRSTALRHLTGCHKGSLPLLLEWSDREVLCQTDSVRTINTNLFGLSPFGVLLARTGKFYQPHSINEELFRHYKAVESRRCCLYLTKLHLYGVKLTDEETSELAGAFKRKGLVKTRSIYLGSGNKIKKKLGAKVFTGKNIREELLKLSEDCLIEAWVEHLVIELNGMKFKTESDRGVAMPIPA